MPIFGAFKLFELFKHFRRVRQLRQKNSPLLQNKLTQLSLFKSTPKVQQLFRNLSQNLKCFHQHYDFLLLQVIKVSHSKLEIKNNVCSKIMQQKLYKNASSFSQPIQLQLQTASQLTTIHISQRCLQIRANLEHRKLETKII
eukprot:TRINITY_DN1734_c0_g1_i4.p1 TRINITY_DN1734_c0_g1~~TRINITY_DN1734_c0_g1_i4.p1  ORF type:complete len:157 (-),score=0.73 TRINITY_DN1734_c0_g1_i4:72-497(-)